MSSSSAFDSNTTVGIVSQNQSIVRPLKKTEDFDGYKNKAKAEKAYKDGDISGYIVVKETSTQLVANYYGTESLDNDVKTKLFRVLNTQQQALNLRNAKLSEEQMQSLSQKLNLLRRLMIKS